MVVFFSIDIDEVTFTIGSVEETGSIQMYALARDGTTIDSDITTEGRDWYFDEPSPPNPEVFYTHQTYTFTGAIAALVFKKKAQFENYGIDNVIITFTP